MQENYERICMKLPVKQIIAAGIVGTVGIAGLTTFGIANAETSSNTSDGPMSSLVEKIANTFNLDRSKVQEVFDTDRTERETEREAEQAERLQALVDDGTITAAQKTAIEAKIKEMKAERDANKDAMKDLTNDERKAKMDEKRKALETWAKEQGLDLSTLKGILGGPGGGHGGPRGE
jgi:hypothetical protein